MFIILIYMVTRLNRNEENEKKEKNILERLKTLKFKIQNDRKEIRQKMNHQQNNQTLSMNRISPRMNLLFIRHSRPKPFNILLLLLLL